RLPASRRFPYTTPFRSFGAAGVGMLAGLLIYLWGSPYLPAERSDAEPVLPAGIRTHRRRDTILILLGIGLAVTIFRGAYEQMVTDRKSTRLNSSHSQIS